MKYDLFISYSRADFWDKNQNIIPGNIVSQIVDTLEAYQEHYKFEYFFDQEAIDARATYLRRIAAAIDESKVMLFVASANSYASEFCSKELNFADKRQIPIFQYCIDNAKMPLDIELLLGTHQFRSSKHYSVEKIVQDALSKALGRKIKPLSELSQISLHLTTAPKQQSKLSLPASILKRIVGFVNKKIVTLAVVIFSLFLLFWAIGTIASDDKDKETVTHTEQNRSPLTAKHQTIEEIDSSLTAEQLQAKANEFYKNKDYNSAVQYYRKAAEQGYAYAQNDLGVCYKNGYGVAQDYTEAVKWYRRAAEQGYAYAQNNLGKCYEFGRGVTQDYTEAVKWYRKAAEQGHKFAQNNLGRCYENGRGVAQNYSETVKWYRKAAEQGHSEAQYNLGKYYENGRGVTQNYSEAVKWYRKAAEQGHSDARFNLGKCYEYGRGVAQDSTEAKKWYRKAAKRYEVTNSKKL